jgi:hypothetical protein
MKTAASRIHETFDRMDRMERGINGISLPIIILFIPQIILSILSKKLFNKDANDTGKCAEHERAGVGGLAAPVV